MRTGGHEARQKPDRVGVAARGDEPQAARVEEVAGEQRGLTRSRRRLADAALAIVEEIALVDELDGGRVVVVAVPVQRVEQRSPTQGRRGGRRRAEGQPGGPALGTS